LLTLDDCITAVEEAFRSHGEGKLHPPCILSAHEARGAFHIKTAAVNGRFGANANANANANFPGQVPSIQGVMLGEIVGGHKPGRTSDDEVFIFDSTGIGFQNTAAASIVYDRALQQNRGFEVNLAR
jgi:ornithine cyclodeaminase/alanine dehydrogenase-like protein (mu-crystallin family)